jgi:hypothetical protein
VEAAADIAEPTAESVAEAAAALRCLLMKTLHLFRARRFIYRLALAALAQQRLQHLGAMAVILGSTGTPAPIHQQTQLQRRTQPAF